VPRNVGSGTADPKLKLLEHLRACSTCNPAISLGHLAERTSTLGQPQAMGLMANTTAFRGPNLKYSTQNRKSRPPTCYSRPTDWVREPIIGVQMVWIT